jgi:hypothetical protein
VLGLIGFLGLARRPQRVRVDSRKRPHRSA